MIRSTLAMAILLCATMPGAGPAQAASTGWQETEGAQLRLVVEDRPGAGGMLRGALEIMLEPGWKTYWREPGDAGVPPRLSLDGSANAADVTLHFPAPRRFSDEWSTWAGYGSSMAIALEFRPLDPGVPVTLKSTAFLGICEDICIPVEMSFMLETNPSRPVSEPAVAEAFAALPRPARDGFSVTDARLDDGALVIDASVEGDGGEADLFLAPSKGLMLDVPERITTSDGNVVFRAGVLSAPKDAGTAVVDYTLVGTAGAVSGRFEAQ